MIYIPFILMIPRAMISRQYCRHGLNRYAQSASTFSTKFCQYLNVYLKIVVSVAEENYCSTSSHGGIKSKLFSTFILHKGGQNARCSNQAFTLILAKLFQIMIIGLELLHYQRKRGDSVGKNVTSESFLGCLPFKHDQNIADENELRVILLCVM